MRATLGLLIALAMLPVTITRAEQQSYGRYDVYYSVFASDFLQPATAQALGIVRAADRAVLNLSVRRRGDDGGDVAVAATVEGTRGDLIRDTPLAFREVVEDEARYYIAEFPVRNDEKQFFRLRILPEGEASPLELRFEKTLYVD